MKYLIAVLISCFIYPQVFGQYIESGKLDQLEQKTQFDVGQKVRKLLQKYCLDSCVLQDVDVVFEEQLENIEDIGFEGIGEDSGVDATYVVSSLAVSVQIDDRIASENRNKLDKILRNNLSSYTNFVTVRFIELSVPDIGQSVSANQRAISDFNSLIEETTRQTISKYCPETCMISNIQTSGNLVSADTAENSGVGTYIRDKASGRYLLVDKSRVSVAFSESMNEAERGRIESVLNLKLKQYPNVRLSRVVMPFPKTHSEKLARAEAESADPYGLNKLKKTLSLFKEFSTDDDIIRNQPEGVSKNLIIAGVLGLVAILILAAFLKYSSVKQEASLMKQAADYDRQNEYAEKQEQAQVEKEKKEEKERKRTQDQIDLEYTVKSDELIEELTENFFKIPKLAKETFGKMLEQDGVEQTSKYVHILGKTVVFDLLKDPNYRRILRDLSEYYNKVDFKFSPEEQYDLLSKLKVRATATEIRLASRGNIEAFEFLGKLDTDQVYALIKDENTRLQSVVLSQLPSAKRQKIFGCFDENNRASLMGELCSFDSIPREYLMNVAKSLLRKVQTNSEYDTEKLRSNDVLLDLLEKSNLDEQIKLMGELEQANSDTAANIKSKLVTVHVLRYMKVGHLLEVVLDLEHEELILFMQGAPEEVTKILLRNAPEELADAWAEELDSRMGYDDQDYRAVELKLLNRIKSLAASGSINISDINDVIFFPEQDHQNDQIEESSYRVA